MKVVGVTACPSGVAHTYMSAEALVLAGEKYGVDVKIVRETCNDGQVIKSCVPLLFK